jgi:hypothetical protein
MRAFEHPGDVDNQPAPAWIIVGAARQDANAAGAGYERHFASFARHSTKVVP